MQPFLAFACVVAVPTAIIFFLLWRSAENAANHHSATLRTVSDQLRQKTVEHDQVKRELSRRDLIEAGRKQKRSAAVSKGNRARAGKRAEKAAAFFASLTPATKTNVSVGTRLIADGGFSCVKERAELVIGQDDGGLFFPCGRGVHHIDGQLDADGGYIGLYLAADHGAGKAA